MPLLKSSIRTEGTIVYPKTFGSVELLSIARSPEGEYLVRIEFDTGDDKVALELVGCREVSGLAGVVEADALEVSVDRRNQLEFGSVHLDAWTEEGFVRFLFDTCELNYNR